MMKTNKQHFGLSRFQRLKYQIRELQKQVEQLKSAPSSSSSSSVDIKKYSEELIIKDDLVRKLKDRVLDLEKKLGNKVYQIICSQHGFNFSYDENCPNCIEEKRKCQEHQNQATTNPTIGGKELPSPESGLE